MRICAITTGSLLFCLLVAPSLAFSTERFDPLFEQTAAQYLYPYLPDDDWKWWLAQCYQESRLRADAISPAGAVGICQLMPGAAMDAGIWDRLNPELNIKAGAWILRRNIRTWWPRPTRLDRLKLGWCGYNAGVGNCIKAQALCDGASLWEAISPCLPQVTGHHAKETQDYIRLIPKWYQQFTQ